MSGTSSSGTKSTVVIRVAVAVAVLAGGYFAVGAFLGDDIERDLRSGDSERVIGALARVDNERLASDGSADLRQKALETLRGSPESMFSRLRSDEISDEERQNLRRNMREVWMDEMNRRIDEYEKAAEDEKEEILDRQLDEFIEMREQMRSRRAERDDDPEAQAERERRRAERRAAGHRPTREDRKNRMEGTNPDRAVRMMKYWRKMMERAEARGIDFGWGRRGGGRGHRP